MKIMIKWMDHRRTKVFKVAYTQFATYRNLGLKVESSRPLRNRFHALRRSIARAKTKKRAKLLATIHNLNILPDECDADVESLVWDAPPEKNPEIRELRTQVGDLQRNLSIAERELKKQDETIVQLQSESYNAAAHVAFLTSHNKALDAEVVECRQEVSELKSQIKQYKAESLKEEKSRNQVLGRKKFSDLGKDAVCKTRAAYRQRVVEEVNKFGANRGLVVEQLVLRDDEGRQLHVNAEKPETYDKLKPDQKRRVANASLWKDTNRVSDKIYSTLCKVGQFPCASHVKCFEAELNEQVGKVKQVIDV